jgi:hypothetical protein
MIMHYKIREALTAIKTFFNPRQKWLTRKIPNHWMDKDGLIELVLFECIKHYVEQEKGLQDQLDWDDELKNGFVCQEYVGRVKDVDSRLRKVYDYVKTERPALQKAHLDSYPELGTKGSYEELYGETNRLEQEIFDKDTEAMKTLIELRHYMWT